MEAEKIAQTTVPPLKRYSHCKPREFVLIASYCGDDDSACSEKRPCPSCLAMCNVFSEDGTYLRQLGEIKGWQTVPIKPTHEMAYAAASAFYGKRRAKKFGGIDGITVTDNSLDHSFWWAFQRFWKGALSASPTRLPEISPSIGRIKKDKADE